MTLTIDQLKRDLINIDKAIEDKTESFRLAKPESEFNGIMQAN